MTITRQQNTNGHVVEAESKLHKLDSSKLSVMFAPSLRPLPDPESLVFGEAKTDHMLVVTYHPSTGWSSPEIKPYAPLELDPMASCFHYCPNVFEGMKAYMGPNGEARLFRPQLNMERLKRSAARVALPPFDSDELLKMIRKLIDVEKRWIPSLPGYSLYVRPTIVGTRPALGVHASDHAVLFVLVSPTGPYFPSPVSAPASTSVPIGLPTKGISLFALSSTVRAWPGGTGGHKLGVNYAPGFLPQREAMKDGWDQILWLFKDSGIGGGRIKDEEVVVEEWITEVGAMNFFIVIQKEGSENEVEVITPPLDGTILPGVTRASSLALLSSFHKDPSSRTKPHPLSSSICSSIGSNVTIHTSETPLSIQSLLQLSQQNRLIEAFGVGTAATVAPIAKIGYQDPKKDAPQVVHFKHGENGLGPVGRALWEALVGIQTGKVEWDGWSVVC